MKITRRALIGMGALASLGISAGCKMTGNDSSNNDDGMFRLTLAGQALIGHDICAQNYAGLSDVIRELGRGDVVFTDLETAIRTPLSGEPTRDTEFLHTTGPESLRCLKDMGFNLLALSNNHAWDLGTAGVLATRTAVAEAGFAFAGTGNNLSEAVAAGYQSSQINTALVAMAVGKIRHGAAATNDRPGVNELRVESDGKLNMDDVERNLAEIKNASKRAGLVIAYLHNHIWGDDFALTAEWNKTLARQCIDSGAAIFVSHGAPLLKTMEIYRGRPIFYGLGSLIFQSRTKLGHYRPEVWQSAIVHLEYNATGLQRIEIVPVSLNEQGEEGERHLPTRGRPILATGDVASSIIQRFANLSDALGNKISVRNDRGYIQL
jgi:poly-gamma-glutamate capsule biosynthesis protein CapA/YwtB (metallophosphatase superfamily)